MFPKQNEALPVYLFSWSLEEIIIVDETSPQKNAIPTVKAIWLMGHILFFYFYFCFFLFLFSRSFPFFSCPLFFARFKVWSPRVLFCFAFVSFSHLVSDPAPTIFCCHFQLNQVCYSAYPADRPIVTPPLETPLSFLISSHPYCCEHCY